MELFTNRYIVIEDDADNGKTEIEVTATNDTTKIVDGEFTEVSYFSPRYGKWIEEAYDTVGEERMYSPEACAMLVASHEARENATYYVKKED